MSGPDRAARLPPQDQTPSFLARQTASAALKEKEKNKANSLRAHLALIAPSHSGVKHEAGSRADMLGHTTSSP